MEQVKRRREMYAEATRRALLDVGLQLFVERGFTATSAEDIVHAAGLSRGALYHHFDGKIGLFEAILKEQEQSAVLRIAEALSKASDPWQQAMAGMLAYLDICCESNYREIVLAQGPIALGWRRWRELDRQHFLGILTSRVSDFIDAGLIVSYPAELIAATIYGTLTELALAIAESKNSKEARSHAGDLVERLLRSVTVQAG